MRARKKPRIGDCVVRPDGTVTAGNASGVNDGACALLLASESGELGALLDDAARQFAEAVGGAEGSEGTLAFVQKRKPVWAQ